MGRPRRPAAKRSGSPATTPPRRKFTLSFTPEEFAALIQKNLGLTTAEAQTIQSAFQAVLAFQRELADPQQDPCRLQPPCDRRTFWRFQATLDKNREAADAFGATDTEAELDEQIRRYWAAYWAKKAPHHPAPEPPNPTEAEASPHPIQEEVDRLRQANCPWATIADHLNTLGWRTLQGGLWQANQVRQDWQHRHSSARKPD